MQSKSYTTGGMLDTTRGVRSALLAARAPRPAQAGCGAVAGARAQAGGSRTRPTAELLLLLLQASARGSQPVQPLGIAMDGANELGAVESEAVDVVFLEPHQDIIEEELTDLAAPVIGPGFSPRRLGPVVVVEVNSAAIVLGPAIELPKIEVARAQVVVNNVQDHRDTLLVGALDELLERQTGLRNGSPPRKYGRGCNPTTGLPQTRPPA